jgi:hypothetical protein
MSDNAYQFLNNVQRLSGMERGDAYDLKAFEFPNMAEIRALHKPQILELPNPTFFYEYSTDQFITTLDSFSALGTGCIYSRRMINVLLSVREFKHQMYPIAVLEKDAMKDDDGKLIQPYKDPKKFVAKTMRSDLFLFQTLEFIDAFDWEKSDYRQSELNKEVGSPGSVNEYVLKEPSEGFPPLFRLVNDPITLFVSVEAREALKAAQIQGPAFLSLRGYRPNSQLQIDVPIPR